LGDNAGRLNEMPTEVHLGGLVEATGISSTGFIVKKDRNYGKKISRFAGGGFAALSAAICSGSAGGVVGAGAAGEHCHNFAVVERGPAEKLAAPYFQPWPGLF
jgi:hypothetical protein